jgi:Glutamine amidotransferase domain
MEQRYVRSELFYRRSVVHNRRLGPRIVRRRIPHILGDVQYHTSLATELSAQTVASIIDVSSAGHQPMVSKTGRSVIVFNGEAYNFLELKREQHRYDLGRNFRKSTTLFGSGGCVDDPQLFADGDLIRFVSDHVHGRCRASEASVPARDQPKLSAARRAARKNATRIFLNRRRP